MLNPAGPSSRAATVLLSAPALAYRTAVRIRAALYDIGLLKSRALPCPTLSIGNLTVGGTGKTPVTSYLAGVLSASGYRVAVLSRGYGRRSERTSLVVSDGRSILADPVEAGDEPYLIAYQNPAVVVAVGADRIEASRLVAAWSPEVFLLDDAFQHRRVARDLDLLLVDGRDPWGNGRLLPLGPLREPPSALARADGVVVTRGEGRCPPPLESAVGRHGRRVPLFHVRILPAGYARADGGQLGPSALKGFAVYAFSGIARPARFEDDLRSLGVRVVGARRFSDHHPYRGRDLEAIARAARDAGAEALVTTEKDLIRIAGAPEGGLPLYALRLRIDPEGGTALTAFVLERLRTLASRRSTGGGR